MRYLTNEYRDSQVMDLGSASSRGPYVVTQTGVAPDDPAPRTHLFVLRPDGRWADFNAYVCQGKPEAMDELVFTNMAQVMATFARLTARPQVVDLPVDEAGLNAWIERQKESDPLQRARAWAVEYKARHLGKR